MKKAYVFNEDVYENDFKCPICGAKLINKDGTLTDNVAFIPIFDRRLFCRKCIYEDRLISVAFIEWVDTDAVGFQGCYDDYLKGKEN